MRVVNEEVYLRLHVRALASGGLFQVDGEERLGPLGVGGLSPDVLDESAVGVEDDDALVAPVGDVNAAVGIDRYA